MGVVTVAGSQVKRDVDRPSVVRERLEAFAGEMLGEAMNRPVQMRNGGLYLRGLIADGSRKSLEPLVARLGEEADYQSMQQFLAIVRGSRGGWSRRSLSGSRRRSGSRRGWWMTRGLRRTARTRLVSSGSIRGRSGGRELPARVSLHAVGRWARCRWGFRCISRRSGVRTPTGGARAKIPDAVAFQTKYELAAELVERAWRWQVPRAPVLGDHD